MPQAFRSLRCLAVLVGLLHLAIAGSGRAADFHAWAPTPPMGWNSWDCFATTVTEAQVLDQASVMASKLKGIGWEYVVVDIQWYEPGATSFEYRKDATLVMDGFGRLLPAPNRFPSSANGAGFSVLAERIHALGLKFGVHLLRGIPRLAVEKDLPILGTNHRASQIADKERICSWNGDMYGVDMSKPGAQAYYDSVFALFAQWHVDFVKVDDLSRPYFANQSEVEAIRLAIDHSGRPMVLSLSPGETDIKAADHVVQHANMWRISDDFWDKWSELKAQFGRLDLWAAHRLPGAYPDADMLPLGVIGQGRRTQFTPDEQKTMLSLWSIAKSPLILGADLTQLDLETLALITRREAFEPNQSGSNPRQVSRSDDGIVVWLSESATKGEYYVGVFNLEDVAVSVSSIQNRVIRVAFKDLGLTGAKSVHDLWSGLDLEFEAGGLSLDVPAHGSRLVRVKAE